MPAHELVEIKSQTDAMTRMDEVVYSEIRVCSCGHESVSRVRMYVDPNNRRWTDERATRHKNRARDQSQTAWIGHLADPDRTD